MRRPNALVVVLILLTIASVPAAHPAHAQPAISLTPSAGPPGVAVVVSGSGFDPTDTLATLSNTPSGLGAGGVTCPISPISSGSFSSCSFTVSNTAAGSYIVTATGDMVSDSASATFRVPSITLTPNSGSVGTVVSVSGSGFNPADYCNSGSFGGTLNVQSTSCSMTGGTINSASFTVGSNSLGTYTVTLIGSTLDSAQATFTVGPSISLSPTSGPVGTVVTVSGSGFASADVGPITNCHAAPDFGISSPTSPSMVTAAGTCTFSASGALSSFSFTVGNVAPGSYVIQVKGDPAGDAGQATFTVTGPTISLNPTSGPVGTLVTVSGSGFAPADAGPITNCNVPPFGISSPTSTTVISGPATCTFTSSGALIAFTFSVGNVAPGAYVIQVEGSPIGDFAQATFTVTSTTATLTLNPTSGLIGTLVTVSGSGWSSTDSTCSLTGTPVASGPSCSISGGTLSGSFVVDNQPAGTYGVTAHSTGGGFETVSAPFTILAPSITLNPTSGQPGVTVSVTGVGFKTLDASCSFAASPAIGTPDPCSISGGTVSASFVVFNAAAGLYTITIDGASGCPTSCASAPFQVTSSPTSIILTPSSAQVGTTVQVSGSGFGPSDTTCSLSGVAVASGPTCSVSGGVLTGSFVVDNVIAGFYSVIATGTQVGDSAAAPLSVLPPTINFNPTSGPPGTTITVTGTGFSTAAGTCSFVTPNVVINSPHPCTLNSGSNTVSASFVIANVAPGLYPVTVQDSPTLSASASILVTSPTPTISLNPMSGPDGTVVTVSGSNFAPSDVGPIASCHAAPDFGISSPTSVSIITLAGICTFTASGALNAFTFTIGNVASGPYVIQVKGDPVGDVAQATFTVSTTAPEITLNPTSGPVGTVVTVSGSGFAPGDAPNTIPFCTAPPLFGISSPTSTSIITAAGACTFSASGVVSPFTFTVGNVPNGLYVIQVEGESVGDAGQATFTVTSPLATLTLNPTSGHIGTVVTVSGSSWSSTDSTCSLTGTPVASGPTCNISGGTLSGSFTVDNQLAGAYSVTATATSGAGEIVSKTFTILAPTITVNPTSGVVGQTISVTGSGFFTTDGPSCSFTAVNPAVGSPDPCSISGGVVSASFVVFNTAPGPYTVTINGGGSCAAGDCGSALFTINPLVPTLVFNPSSPQHIGTHITVSGLHWALSDSTCTIGGPPVAVGSTCLISGGNLSGSFVVDNVAAAPYTVTTTATSGAGEIVSAPFTVLAPSITLNPTFGVVGQTISVTGLGFFPSDLSCGFDAVNPAVGSPDPCTISTGSVTASFAVFNTAPGLYTIKVDGAGGCPNDCASASFVINSLSPTVIFNPPSPQHIGVHITVSGAGWSPGDSTCTIGGVPVTAGSTCSISGGTLTGSFVVDNVAAAPYTVTTTATSGAGEIVSAPFTVLAPSITLNPTSGVVGQTISVSGVGYFPGDASCMFDAVNPAVGANSCTISNGSILASFVVFNTVPGLYTVKVDGAGGCPNDCASASFVINSLSPTVIFTPLSPRHIGTNIAVSGSGWSPADSTCTIGGAPVAAGSTCLISGGTLTGSFIVDNVAAGPYTITTHSTGGAFETVVSPFTVLAPSITVIPTSAAKGTPLISVTGTGFFPSDGSCMFDALNPAVGSPDPCAISGGNVAASFTVATTPNGPYTIQIDGAGGCPNDCASASFTVDPTIALSPSSIGPGGAVTVSGSNFNPSDTSCVISSTKAGLVSSSTCSVSSGVVAGSFTVGSVASGTYTVRVTGNKGDVANAALTVTSISQVTMTVSYSVVGGGSPTPPIFNYVLNSNPKTLTLTKTAKAVSVDAGSTWSVTPSTGLLTGSSSSERWFSSQSLSGTASATPLVFTYQHQYFLTMKVSSSTAGSALPPSGWHNAGQTITIKATAKTVHSFKSWTGSGIGSYTGTSASHTITMNSAITETANFT